MDVKVRAESVDGRVEWTIDGKKPHKSVISCPRKSGPHTVNFHLDDETGLGLSFQNDALWVHENEAGQCPPGTGILTDQISISSVKPGKLTISNSNEGAPRTLQYQLNFVDANGASVSVDPCIKNGGST
jgi:hypothetical protein